MTDRIRANSGLPDDTTVDRRWKLAVAGEFLLPAGETGSASQDDGLLAASLR
jgi:hypothetical protein